MLDQLRLYSLIFVACSALLLILLERHRPYTPGQKFIREGFWDDFFLYTFVQSYLLGLLISWIIELIDTQTGLSRLKLFNQVPVWGQFLFFLFSHDLYIYWFHRWQHHSPLLWKLHEAHHSTKDVDWLSGSRSHPLEILINQTIEFAPIILLGAHPAVAILKGSVDAVWGMYIHSNVDVRSGKLQYIINGPEMHRWHHADESVAHNKNFGTKFAFWDWVFGTAFHPPKMKAGKYGLTDRNFPVGYIKQVLHPFKSKPSGK